MEIKSLYTEEKTDEGIYDINIGSVIVDINVKIKPFPLTDLHTGKPWKVSFDIYANNDNIDIICDMNGIYNPLSMKSGDIIYYVEPDDVPVVRNSKQSTQIKAAIEKLKNANKGKQSKNDSSRQKDKALEKQTEKQKQLVKKNNKSPNLISNPEGNIKYGEGKITLFPNF